MMFVSSGLRREKRVSPFDVEAGAKGVLSRASDQAIWAEGLRRKAMARVRTASLLGQ